ncbi:MAG: stage 0 sporulation protein [Bacilli bacterium]|nr:stage 0 sporulation protein [Bacilli bacterium]
MVKKYIVQVKYSHLSKPTLFTTDIEDLKIGDAVLITTERGEEIGTIASKPTNIENFSSRIDASSIIGRPTETELHIHKDNLKRAKDAIKIASAEANKLNLGMNFIDAEYTLDASKLVLIYTAEGRVDFRELLKILTQRLHTRIEFHQIGARDKAKETGGIGPCGRELCCLSFLKSFDGISINRAKNQQLSLNNAKLSGSCGKLMCCLLFEDDTYTQEAKNYPIIGSTIKKDKVTYKVLGFNIISQTIKCEGPEGIVFLKLKDIKK